MTDRGFSGTLGWMVKLDRIPWAFVLVLCACIGGGEPIPDPQTDADDGFRYDPDLGSGGETGAGSTGECPPAQNLLGECGIETEEEFDLSYWPDCEMFAECTDDGPCREGETCDTTAGRCKPQGEPCGATTVTDFGTCDVEMCIFKDHCKGDVITDPIDPCCTAAHELEHVSQFKRTCDLCDNAFTPGTPDFESCVECHFLSCEREQGAYDAACEWGGGPEGKCGDDCDLANAACPVPAPTEDESCQLIDMSPSCDDTLPTECNCECPAGEDDEVTDSDCRATATCGHEECTYYDTSEAKDVTVTCSVPGGGGGTTTGG